MSTGVVTEPGTLFSGANHICIVTADLDRAVRRWWNRYRVGPWRVFSYDSSNMQAKVNGSPVDLKMRAALAQLGQAFRLEIIQPLDELGPYAESLSRAGGADHVHHVRLDVPDFAGTRDELVVLGLPVRLEASFKGGSSEHRFQAMYFDARDDLGLLLEIGHAPAGFSMPEPDYVYPR
jgi:catechol 2,3-dioxygenase-like lactoylglutathione lyase family enzyme